MPDEFFIQPKEYDISNPYKVTVKSNVRLTPERARDDVHEIILDVHDVSLAYVEGQSIGVLVPPPYDFGLDHHMRLYSIASAREGEQGNRNEIALCVQRCFRLDEVSGEQYPGKCSNYVCDLAPDAELMIAGPYGHHFHLPRDNAANIVMVASGTGIAPFRAFIKHIYEEEERWEGEVRLYHEASGSLALEHMHLEHHYLQSTFKAFEALQPEKSPDGVSSFVKKLEENAEDLWELMDSPKTHVYVAGMRKASENLDEALSHIAGSREQWLGKKRSIFSDGRWAEHLYD